MLDAPEASEADGKDADEQARDWQIAVEQAETISKLAGKLPAGLERSLQGAEEARVDWRDLLRRAWSETTPSDYSWMRPNRRHIWQGLYLPGVQREGVGEVVIFVDCSGSINARQLSLFEAEVRSILEGQRPERVYVVYFDAYVHKVDVYEAGQPVQLTPVGGGGTDFRPCFQWVSRRSWCSSLISTAHYPTNRRRTRCCGHPLARNGAVRPGSTNASGLDTLAGDLNEVAIAPAHHTFHPRRPELISLALQIMSIKERFCVVADTKPMRFIATYGLAPFVVIRLYQQSSAIGPWGSPKSGHRGSAQNRP